MAGLVRERYYGAPTIDRNSVGSDKDVTSNRVGTWPGDIGEETGFTLVIFVRARRSTI